LILRVSTAAQTVWLLASCLIPGLGVLCVSGVSRVDRYFHNDPSATSHAHEIPDRPHGHGDRGATHKNWGWLRDRSILEAGYWFDPCGLDAIALLSGYGCVPKIRANEPAGRAEASACVGEDRPLTNPGQRAAAGHIADRRAAEGADRGGAPHHDGVRPYPWLTPRLPHQTTTAAFSSTARSIRPTSRCSMPSSSL
jgi:hypothetical protein